MTNVQDRVEEILEDNPTMPTMELVGTYLRKHALMSEYEIRRFIEVLKEFYVPSIVRCAAKYRQKLGIRDEVRDQTAELHRRHQSEAPMLEANPPEMFPEIDETKRDYENGIATGLHNYI